jgi:hypothetical protein
MTNKHPWTTAQIEKDCPVKLQDLGKRINVHLAKATQCDDKAEQHRISAGQLLAEAKAACDNGGFNKFRELFCPSLGKSRAHELLQIASGKKTVDETKTATRERVKKHRAAKATAPMVSALQPSVTVTDDAEPSAEKRKAEYAAADGDTPRTNGDDTEVDTLAKAEALRTKIAVAETVKIDSTASAKALAEFKVACETCLPKLTVNDLQAAIDFFAETVEVEELMPDVKGLQWPTNTGSKLNCSQGRHS